MSPPHIPRRPRGLRGPLDPERSLEFVYFPPTHPFLFKVCFGISGVFILVAKKLPGNRDPGSHPSSFPVTSPQSREDRLPTITRLLPLKDPGLNHRGVGPLGPPPSSFPIQNSSRVSRVPGEKKPRSASTSLPTGLPSTLVVLTLIKDVYPPIPKSGFGPEVSKSGGGVHL